MRELLQRELGEALQACEQVGKELRIRVAPQALVAVAGLCKQHGYTYPCDITAVDMRTELVLVYRLIAPDSGEQVVVKVGAARSGARIPTVSGVYAAAEWLEREVYDLFGVRFEGHPDLRRILLTDDWEGHPLLK
jgi:NADH-quinone oxidoreductase subunit C